MSTYLASGLGSLAASSRVPQVHLLECTVASD